MNNSVITPLNDKNFATWKIQVKMTLIKDDLWNIVKGDEVAPTDTNALQKFNLRKDRALAIIVLSVEPKLLYLLGDPTEPTDTWKKLEDTFQKKSWSNKFRLKKNLYGMRLQDGGNLQNHIKQMMEIFDELAIIGDPKKLKIEWFACWHRCLISFQY